PSQPSVAPCFASPATRRGSGSPPAQTGPAPTPGRRRRPGRPGASPRWASGGRRCACSATSAAPRLLPAPSPSASTLTPASPSPPPHSPGPTLSRSSPCASSGLERRSSKSTTAFHQAHQLQRARLVQGFVEVAALGALHAGGAAGLAGALGDQARGVAEQALELLVAALGDADAAGVAVVDEDGRAAGLEVDVGGEAADVPAVAHRDQWQHGDLAVLGRVQGAEQDVAGKHPAELLRQHVPERLGNEALLRQLQGDDVDRLLLGDRDALEGDYLLGHGDVAEVELDAGDLALLAGPFDVDLRLLFRPRVPVAVEAGDDRAALVDVEPLDLVGTPEVEVDRAGMDRREGALGLDHPQHLPRLALDHRDRVGG